MLELLQKKEIRSKEESNTDLLTAYEQALDNVGLMHVDAGEMLVKYIDFLMGRENLQMANLICFLAAGTPLNDGKDVQTKYLEILENNFESIFEGLVGENSGKDVPEKYKAQYKELGK